MTDDWLARGGAYVVIGIGWVLIAGGAYYLAHYLGKLHNSPNDGCLLGIGNVLLTFFGGGIGLLIGKFPYYLVSSIVLAALLPTLATLSIDRRMRKER